MIGVIDIGAHWFEEREQWIKEGAKYFLLFEPVMANHDYLVAHFPDIMTYRYALGNQTGEIKMYLDPKHDNLSASVLKPTLHQEDYPDICFDSYEIVRIDKLDNFIYDRESFDYIHLVAQGMELEILKGAEKSLKYINTIKSQVWRKKLYEGSFITEEMTEYLDKQGFELKEIIKRGISWDNAVYQRKEHVEK